jgi:signal transduction histidine kinase
MRSWHVALPSPRLCTWIFVISLASVMLLAMPKGSLAASEPKRVLMLHSFGLRFKPWTDYAQFIRSGIAAGYQGQVDFHDHSLLNARLGVETSDGPFVDYLYALYADHPPDLIVAIGAPAANFVQRYRQRVFPGTPMLFTAVEARRVQYDKLTQDDTVVAVAHDFPSSFEHILRVLPRTTMIAVVNGASANENFWQGELERETAPLRGRVELKFYNKLSFQDILKDAAHLPAHSAIFWHLMNVDAAGIAYEANAALSRLSATANAPIFSYLDNFFGDSTTVGGPLHSVEEGSAAAAAVAVRILNGEKAGDIKTPPTRYASPKYDWRVMQRFDIGESALPPGSQILFRDPSLWETHRWQIVGVVATLLLQAAMIAWLLYEHQLRRMAEVEGRQRMAELAHMNRQATAGQLSTSIAHELNQPLGAILNNAETATLFIGSPSPDLQGIKGVIDDIKLDVVRASEVIKRLRRLLSRGAIEAKEVDLNDVVRDVIKTLSVQAAARDVRLSSSLVQKPLPVNGDHVQLQQVILNLVLNAMDAVADTPNGKREIACASWALDGVASISVRDTGPGIAPDQLERLFEPFFTTKHDGMGMGLAIARTITEAHGGRISAESHSSGAVFKLSVPLTNGGSR